MATEWVPIQDTATAWPGLLWWDVKAREGRRVPTFDLGQLPSPWPRPMGFTEKMPRVPFEQTRAYRKNRALLEAHNG